MADALDLSTPSGTVHAESTGPADGRLVLLVHGLSANLRGFDAIIAGIARDDRRVVAIDLRGRGGSPDSGPGSYGLEAHARTVLEVADELGASEFDYVGWSLGGMIGLQATSLAAHRPRSLTLIDVGGAMDPAGIDVVRAGLARLDAVVDDPEDYLAAIRAVGVVDPWEPIWDGFYRYELAELPDGAGWSPRTSRAACEEDLGMEPGIADHLCELWGSVTMPALLIRAEKPLGAGGLIVPDHALADMQAAIPQLQVQPSERNHWTVMTDPAAVRAIDALLDS